MRLKSALLDFLQRTKVSQLFVNGARHKNNFAALNTRIKWGQQPSRIAKIWFTHRRENVSEESLGVRWVITSRGGVLDSGENRHLNTMISSGNYVPATILGSPWTVVGAVMQVKYHWKSKQALMGRSVHTNETSSVAWCPGPCSKNQHQA